jgi:hypothetical protein
MPPKKKEVAKPAPDTTVEETSILRFLMSLNQHSPQLDFGVNLDCRLVKIDNTPRMREGEVVKRNTYLTFAKYNKKNEVIGQTEFNFFNLDPESKYTFDNFVEQLSKLTVLAKILAPDETYDPTTGFKSAEDIEEALKAPKSCKVLQDKMYNDFEEIVADKIGIESPLIALKVVTEKSGKYLQLPREDKFCSLMSGDYSFLKISAYELKMKESALVPQTSVPDEKGKAPSDKSSVLSGI